MVAGDGRLSAEDVTTIGSPGGDQPASAAPDLLGTTAAGPVAARGGAIRAGGFAVATLLGLVSAPLMIRHLGVEDFGRYATVLALVAVISGVTEAGLATIALREYASRKGAARIEALRDLLGIRLALTSAGIALGVAFAVVAGYPPVLVVGTAVAGAALLLQSLQTMIGSALQGELRFGWITLLEVLRQATFVALVVVLVLVGAGLGSFFLVQIPAFALTLAITAVLVRRLMPLRPTFHLSRWWPLLRDTAAYAAAIALNAMYFRTALIALSLLSTEQQTGYMATALRVMEVLLGVPALVFGAAFPILARAAQDDRERLESAAARLVELAVVLGVAVALVLLLAAEPIVTVLAGDRSDPSIALLRIEAVALIATFVAVAAGYVLLALRRHRDILLGNVVALLVALTITPLLIVAHDSTGAAIGVLAAELALGAVTLTLLVRSCPRVALALRRAPRIFVAGALAGLAFLIPGLPAIGDTLLAMIAYAALLAALGRFPPEIADAVRGAPQRDARIR